MIGSQVEAKNLKLKIRIDEDVPSKVEADSQRIMQMVMNLVTNAIKFTKKGFIYVHLSNDKGYSNQNWKRLIFTVRDTGVGIKQENINKLFKLFGNVRSINKINQTGVGLGLAFCKNVV